MGNCCIFSLYSGAKRDYNKRSRSAAPRRLISPERSTPMKHHRRFAAILLILALIAGLALPASAAESAQAPHWEKIGRRFYWIQEDGTVLKKGG
jgi:hypothetical protein